MTDAATPEFDRLVAAEFPKEWARMEAGGYAKPGKKRRQLRQRYRVVVAFREFKAANPGAMCLNCRSFEPHNAQVDKPVCHAESDFHGYAIARHDGLCMKWKRHDD